MLDPRYLGSTAVMIGGILMIALSHTLGFGIEFVFLGIVVLSLGITLSAVFAGVANPYAVLTILGGSVILLTLITIYNVGGLRGYI